MLNAFISKICLNRGDLFDQVQLKAELSGATKTLLFIINMVVCKDFPLDDALKKDYLSGLY